MVFFTGNFIYFLALNEVSSSEYSRENDFLPENLFLNSILFWHGEVGFHGAFFFCRTLSDR